MRHLVCIIFCINLFVLSHIIKPELITAQESGLPRKYEHGKSLAIPLNNLNLDDIKLIRVEYSITGEEWKLAGESEKPVRNPVPIELPEEGLYQIRVIIEDVAGNRHEPQKPDLELVVDCSQPKATFDSNLKAGKDVAPEERVIFTWTCEDRWISAQPVTIETSFDRETWKSVSNDFQKPNDSLEFWFQDNKASKGKAFMQYFRLKAVDLAGNITYVHQEAGFKVIPPNSAIPLVDRVEQGPAKKNPVDEEQPDFRSIPNRVSKHNFDIPYTLKNEGESGTNYVELWYTMDFGQTWVYGGRDDDKTSPFKFKAEKDGIYGFRLIVENGAGTRLLQRPTSGTVPEQNTLTLVDTSPPFVTLKSPRGRENWKAYEKNYIDFTVNDRNLRSVNLMISRNDGKTWETLAQDINPGEKWLWDTSRLNAKNLRVRVHALDWAGNNTIDESEAGFAVDNSAPEIEIGPIGVSDIKKSEPKPKPEPGPDDKMGTDSKVTKTWISDSPYYRDEYDRHFKAGVYFRSSGDYADALKHYKRCMELDDRQADLYYEIGYIHMKQKKNAEAKEMIREAIRLDEKEPFYHAGLAKLYIMEENWVDASIELRRVIDLTPKTADSLGMEARWHLSKIYATLQDFQSSANILREIIDVKDPDSHLKPQAQKALAQLQPLIEEQEKKAKEEVKNTKK